jgi:tetratricopeptide (TPR) repeat protein
VIGFSGGDLKFGDDYFGFAGRIAESPGITWVVRPPRDPNAALISPRVQKMLERVAERGAIVKSDLPDLFSQLGAASTIGKQNPADAEAAETHANQRAAQHLASFFTAKAVAPLRCAGFCAHLLRESGRVQDARVIEDALLETFHVSGNVTTGAALDSATTAVVLAKAELDESDPQRGYDCAVRALNLAAKAKPEASPVDARRWAKVEALACNFRGLAFVMCDDCAEAAESLAQAKAVLGQDSSELALLSTLQTNEAYLARKSGASDEEVLNLVRRAGALARRAGDTAALAAAAHFEAMLLIALGEYDAALHVIETGLDVVSVSGRARDRASSLVQQAKTTAVRGDIEAAFRRMQDVIASLQEHPTLAAGLWRQTTQLLGFHPPLRIRLLEMADNLIVEYDRGRIPAEGAPPNVPSYGEVKQLRTELATNQLPENRMLPKYVGPPRDREEGLRRMIIEREFAGRHNDLPKCFLDLFYWKLTRSDPARLMDISFALRCAAEREQDEPMSLVACCQRIIACQRAGELRRALQEFEQLTCSDAARASAAFASIQQMAGSLQALIGTFQDAETSLRSALRLNLESQNLRAAARTVLSLALAFARSGQYGRAAEILASEADPVLQSADDTLVARRAEMLARFQRRQARCESAMPISIGLSEPLRRASLAAENVPALRALAGSPEDLLSLARYVLGSDLPLEARELALEASLHFGELRDRCGIADCLSFLADVAQTQREWEKAYEFSRMAADVCARLDDRSREISSLALLAFCLYKLEEFGEAEQTAARCLLIVDGQQPSRPMLIAHFVRGAGADHRGDIVDKAMSMAAFLKAYPSVASVDDLAPLRDSFQRVLGHAR